MGERNRQDHHDAVGGGSVLELQEIKPMSHVRIQVGDHWPLATSRIGGLGLG